MLWGPQLVSRYLGLYGPRWAESGPQAAQAIPLRVGLTGGIASGKIDGRARILAASGSRSSMRTRCPASSRSPVRHCVDQIAQRFGALTLERLGVPLLRADGALDRSALRRLIFQDAELRARSSRRCCIPRFAQRWRVGR